MRFSGESKSDLSSSKYRVVPEVGECTGRGGDARLHAIARFLVYNHNSNSISTHTTYNPARNGGAGSDTPGHPPKVVSAN